MKTFNLDKFEKEITNEIKISNFIHFYEVLEASCANTLVEKTHFNYQRNLGILDKQQIEEITNEHFLVDKA
jgi:hypothetical protein